MFTAILTFQPDGQDKFYFLLSDENETHLKRTIYGLSNSLLYQTVNIKWFRAELSTGEKRDFIKAEALTEDEKRNAILEWFKP